MSNLCLYAKSLLASPGELISMSSFNNSSIPNDLEVKIADVTSRNVILSLVSTMVDNINLSNGYLYSIGSITAISFVVIFVAVGIFRSVIFRSADCTEDLTFICDICHDECCEEEELDICDEDHNGCHEQCFVSYLECCIGNGFSGYCPTLHCPCLHDDGKKRIIPYTKWRKLVKPEVLDKYVGFARSTLEFMCGSCHSLNSLQIASNKKAEAFALNHLDELKPTSGIEGLIDDIDCYMTGTMSVEEFYVNLTTKYFPMLRTANDSDAWNLFQHVLLAINNPERRANMHLRYLRSRPRCWSSCCNTMHCFRCKVVGYHEGVSCEDNDDSLDLTIVNCPQCGVALVKGDGCDTVTCGCTNKFSWSREIQSITEAHLFAVTFPVNTAEACADVLCEIREGDIDSAKAWRSRNSVTADAILLQRWLRQYSVCPSQCCIVPEFKYKNDGWLMACTAWRTAHEQEVQKRLRERIITTTELNLQCNFIPVHYGHSLEPCSWNISKQLKFTNGLLSIFGDRLYRPMTLAGTHKAVCHTDFNVDCRGNSCDCEVQNCSRACFAGIIDSLELSSESLSGASSSCWLTFGLQDTRYCGPIFAITDSESVNLAQPYVMLSQRRFEVGDVIMCTMDIVQGWCELSVNCKLLHRHRIPSSEPDYPDYFYKFTIQHDSTRIVRLLSEDKFPVMSLHRVQEVNIDHYEMYRYMQEYLTNILDQKKQMDNEELKSRSQQWQQSLGGAQESLQAYEHIRPVIEEFTGRQLESVTSMVNFTNSQRDHSCCRPTWNNLLKATCWLRSNTLFVEAAKLESAAKAFRAAHGPEEAPYAAAMILHGVTAHISKHSKTADIATARAYMQTFAGDMHAWYDAQEQLNKTTTAPVTGAVSDVKMNMNMVEGCRCLPRHLDNDVECPCADLCLDKLLYG